MVSPFCTNRMEWRSMLRAWADHPNCRDRIESPACLECRSSHLRRLRHDPLQAIRHVCPFGHVLIFMPVLVDGRCLAICMVAIDSATTMLSIDRNVEILEILVENFAARHIHRMRGPDDSHHRDAPIQIRERYEVPVTVQDGWSDAVRQAVELIDAGFADPDLTVSSIASRIGLSRDYASHRFRVETGQRMSRCIFLRRMLHAQHLLMTSRHRVCQIALDSGFLNTDWFSHSFHVHTGMTPTQFRRHAGRSI